MRHLIAISVFLISTMFSLQLFASVEFVTIKGQLKSFSNDKVTIKIGDEILVLDKKRLMQPKAHTGDMVEIKVYPSDLKK